MQFNRLPIFARFGFAALGLGLCALPAAAQTIVSPNSAATVEGNTNNAFPFHYNSSARYQQVYAASEFSGLNGVEEITQIAFRPDALAGSSFSTSFANLQFDLSTTSKAVNGLDGMFANNVGADDTVVRSGAITLSSAFTGPAGGPKDFDILIPLTTPFIYNPANGNLLLDIRKFSTEDIGTELNAADGSGVTSRNFGTNVNDTSRNNNITGSQVGLVTQFTFAAAVPEPGSLALFASVGVTGTGFFLRRRKK